MAARRWKAVLVTLVLAALAFVGLGSWALSSPVGASPDDDFHLASIWCSWGDRDGLCAPGDTAAERTVSEQLTNSPDCYQFKPQQAACGLPADHDASTARGNFTGIYPPVYYAAMGVFASPDVVKSTLIIRFVNAAVFVAAVTAVLLLSRRGSRGPLIWSAVVTLVPLGVFLIPSINPSSWAILSGFTVWAAVAAYFNATSTTKRVTLAILAAVLAVMGAGSRGDAAIYVSFAALAGAILTYQPNMTWLRRAILPLVLIIVGAAFFLSSRQGTTVATQRKDVSPASTEAGDAAAAAASDPVTPAQQILHNLRELPRLWTGVLGAGGQDTSGLGWLDTVMPAIVWSVMLGVFCALVFVGIRFMKWRKALALALALLGLIVIPLYALYGMGAIVGEEVQPRYLMPLMLTFAGIAMYAASRDDLGLSKLQAAVVLFSVTVANSVALHTNIRRYVTGLDVGGFNLNHNIEWWWGGLPVQPLTVWFIGTVAFGLLMAGFYWLLFTKSGQPIMPGSEQPTAEAEPLRVA